MLPRKFWQTFTRGRISTCHTFRFTSFYPFQFRHDFLDNFFLFWRWSSSVLHECDTFLLNATAESNKKLLYSPHGFFPPASKVVFKKLHTVFILSFDCWHITEIKSSPNAFKWFLPELFLLFSDGVNVVVFDLGNLTSSPRYDVHVDHGVNEQQ